MPRCRSQSTFPHYSCRIEDRKKGASGELRGPPASFLLTGQSWRRQKSPFAGDSTPIKKQHGGKRSGAGRRPNLAKRRIGRLAPLSAGQILEGIDIEGTIAEIMKEGSLALKQRTLADLMDRAWGRPAQAVNVTCAVVHAHWTPGKYSHLTDEEFAAR